MKFLQVSGLLMASTLLGSVVASPMEDKINDLTQKLEARQAGRIVAGGVNDGTTGVRMDIRDLAQDKDKLDLYVQGLQRFMAVDQRDPLSYFQIAGIHGVPYGTYNGVGPRSGGTGGYCLHVSNIFLPWHRPYLSLFEQAWYAKVQEVVSEYTGAARQRYAAAAQGLRMPYWDWAVAPPNGDCAFPIIFASPQIYVNTPKGPQTMNNPLYSYQFHSATPLGGNYSQVPSTVRRPASLSAGSRSNNNEVCSIMNGAQTSIRDRLFNLMTREKDYTRFATECVGKRCGNPLVHDSIESLHDVIHNIIGGERGGHMFYLDYAAFDPVFWLHHTNIDRLMAMWQGLNPNSYVKSGVASQNSYEFGAGQELNGNTELKPFYKNGNGQFYTSNDVVRTTTFRYTYPETGSGSNSNSIRQAVNSLYGPNAQRKQLAAKKNPAPAVAAKQAAPSSTPAVAAKQAASSSVSASATASPVAGIPLNVDPSDNTDVSKKDKGDDNFDLGDLGDLTGLGDIPEAVGDAIDQVGDGIGDAIHEIGDNLDDIGDQVGEFFNNLFNWEPKVGDDDYTIEVETDKFAVGGSYAIYFFMGHSIDLPFNVSIPLDDFGKDIIPKNPADWAHSENLVGIYSVLSHNGEMDINVKVSGHVPITSAIRKGHGSGLIESLEQDFVNNFLSKHLVWGVLGPDGNIVPADKLKHLKIAVSSSKYSSVPTTDDGEYKFEDKKYHPEIVAEKPHGVDSSSDEDWDSDLQNNGDTYSGSTNSDGTCPGMEVTYEYVDTDGKFLFSSMIKNDM